MAYDFLTNGIAYTYLGGYVGDANAANVEVSYIEYLSSNNYNGLTNVTIPSTVKNNSNNKTYTVTSIGNWAFAQCQTLKTVSLPNTITNITKGAFYECPALTTVNIPNSVTSIGDYAFDHCTKLTSANIPNSVTSLGKSAFFYCI